ncbi:hypothetical protein [uncultured Brevundimonas sp.]|uniref:hypothetical protein n=1 Tax=uncultured Brevundimonas sp. TaxID=213418 RepID=UPI0030EDD5E9|tara:strand:- start:3885 stop:4367 length:483 start_codon:yes stop_codon:yes gene_type:complete
MDHPRFLCVLAATATVTLLAGGSALASQPECFDAEVSARIARQTPTVMNDCGPDCIVMAWPWIVELDVRRVYSGDLARGPVTVLTVQHTYYNQVRNGRHWWLRRNTLGTYNVLQPAQGETLQKCAADSPAASPFIQPPDGKTLDDLRREGEEYYGPAPYT